MACCWVLIGPAGSWTILFSYHGNGTNSSPSTDAEWRDAINSQSTGSIAANRKNFKGGAFIHNTHTVKTRHARNEVSRAFGSRCVFEYM